jgi:hypothetical protein
MKLFIATYDDAFISRLLTAYQQARIFVVYKKYPDQCLRFDRNHYQQVKSIYERVFKSTERPQLLSNLTASSVHNNDDNINEITVVCDIAIDNPVSSGFYYSQQYLAYNNYLDHNTYASDNVAPVNGKMTHTYYLNSGTISFNIQAFVTTVTGTEYTKMIGFYSPLCLAEGTMITMADGTFKEISTITYNDDLQVWDFDNGELSTAKPLWIKQAEKTNQYNLLQFSNGSSLKTISQHRIFNVEKGKFTYPMSTDTPVGTTTFTGNSYTTLTNKTTIKMDNNQSIKYYNIITNYHINLFANSILTSCRYSNLYPIKDLQYVKENQLNLSSNPNPFADSIPIEYVNGLRLLEQPIPISDSISYVKNLINFCAK